MWMFAPTSNVRRLSSSSVFELSRYRQEPLSCASDCRSERQGFHDWGGVGWGASWMPPRQKEKALQQLRNLPCVVLYPLGVPGKPAPY